MTNRRGEPYLLFHLTEDPEELDNLAAASETEKAQDELLQALFRALAENQCLKPSLLQMPLPLESGTFQRSVRPD